MIFFFMNENSDENNNEESFDNPDVDFRHIGNNRRFEMNVIYLNDSFDLIRRNREHWEYNIQESSSERNNLENRTSEISINVNNSNKNEKFSIFSFIIYLFLGHIFIAYDVFLNDIGRKLRKNIYLFTIFILGIPYFFFQIYINLIILLFYLLSIPFKSFVSEYYNIIRLKGNDLKIKNILYKIIIFPFLIFTGSYFIIILLGSLGEKGKFKNFRFVIENFIGIFYAIIYFPLQFFINILIFLCLIVATKKRILKEILFLLNDPYHKNNRHFFTELYKHYSYYIIK